MGQGKVLFVDFGGTDKIQSLSQGPYTCGVPDVVLVPDDGEVVTGQENIYVRISDTDGDEKPDQEFAPCQAFYGFLNPPTPKGETIFADAQEITRRLTDRFNASTQQYTCKKIETFEGQAARCESEKSVIYFASSQDTRTKEEPTADVGQNFAVVMDTNSDGIPDRLDVVIQHEEYGIFALSHGPATLMQTASDMYTRALTE